MKNTAFKGIQINPFKPITNINRYVLKSSFLILTLMLGFQYCQAQFLKTEGKTIVDTDNNEVILRGIGLGGWMLQEGYMLRTGGAQHEIETRIESLIGAEKKGIFYDAWLANHCTKTDIDSMASWGYNSIRLPMHYKLFTPPIEDEPVAGQVTWNEKGFDMLDNLIAWVKANDMYLILDLHAAPGGQGENADISDYDPSKPSLWESEENRAKMLALWVEIATRYVDEPNIGAYDIINEPNWGFENHESDLNGCAESQNTLLWDLQKDITLAIREVDQNHMIIIEGNCWGNNYQGLPTLWDDNLAISYHKYWNSNSQSSIQGMIDMRNARNAPIWLGETGENSNGWFTDAIELLETNNVGWSWWPLKKMGGNNPLQIEVNQGYQDILDYWSEGGAKPSEDDAYAALMEIAENLKIENNVYHPDVVDAMIRQPHSDETLPFNDNEIAETDVTRIFAVDYDLGRHGFAYFDSEYTNESGSAGGLAWNQGYAYRNDGVDIQDCQDEITNGYNVGWTDDDEWLLYSLDVKVTGAYQIGIRYASGIDQSAFRLYVDGADQTGAIVLENTGGYQDWQTHTLDDIVLYEGTQKVKLLIEKAGFNLNFLELEYKKKVTDIGFMVNSGMTTVSGDEIHLSLNKTIDVAALGEPSTFTVNYGDKSSVINSLAVDPDNSKRLILNLPEGIIDTDLLTLDYSGTEILAIDGGVLNTFSQLPIDNNLPAFINFPSQIEAEDYFYNYGLEHEATTDEGGGENLGYTSTGDYLDYNINVSESSVYQIEARVACDNSAGILEFQQLNESGEIINRAQLSVPITGGWQSWQTVSGVMNFTEGRGKLRIKILQPEFNINWFKFTTTVINEVKDKRQGLLIYPNPTKGVLNILFPDERINNNVAYTVFDLTGSVVGKETHIQVSPTSQIDLSGLKHGNYIVQLNANSQIWRERVFKK